MIVIPERFMITDTLARASRVGRRMLEHDREAELFEPQVQQQQQQSGLCPALFRDMCAMLA